MKKICSKPGCPKDATNKGRCDRHQPKPWTRKSKTSQVTKDPRWQRARTRALQQARHRCARCRSRTNLEVHHKQPVASGGAHYDQTNLQVLCHDCHKKQHHNQLPIVILVGLSGTGKTAIRELLAPRLGLPSLAPDEHGWPLINQRLNQGPAVIECCRIPGSLKRRTDRVGGFIIEVTAPPELRAERLRARGETEATVTGRVGESTALGYEEHIEPDHRVTSTDDPDEIATRLTWLIHNRQAQTSL